MEEADKGRSEFCVTVGTATRTAGGFRHVTVYTKQWRVQRGMRVCIPHQHTAIFSLVKKPPVTGKLLQPEAIVGSKCTKKNHLAAEEAYSAPPNPLAGFKEAVSQQGKVGKETEERDKGGRARRDHPSAINSWIRHW